MMKIFFKINPLLKSSTGFTLLEAMIAVALLALVAVGIAAPYVSGFQSLNMQADRMLLDSRLRSRMEALIATDFDALAGGSEIVSVNGQNFTIAWTVAAVDLSGDGNPEPTAVQVTVSVAGLSSRTLTTILVKHEGRLGKIS